MADARGRLNRGDAAGAVRIAQSLYRRGPDPYDAGSLLAQAYVQIHRPDQAQRVYAELAARYPKDPELAAQVRALSAVRQLSEAQRKLDDGDAIAAIRITQPLYTSGPDFYGAGLVLAQAYMRNQQTDEAQRIYAELAARYPKDLELAIRARALDVDRQLTEAQRQLDDGDAIAAIRIAQPLYASTADPYRAGLLLAQAYLRNKQPDEAQPVYAELAGHYPKDPELRAQSRALEAARQLSKAQRELDDGHASNAIRIAEPLYVSGPDNYQAGLLLAQAYMRNHEPASAQRVYAELFARYPKDPELAVQSVTLLAQTHQTEAAQQAFEALPRSEQQAVVTALSGGVRTLYPNSITISGTQASSSHNMPSDNDANAQLAIAAASGTVVGSVEHAHRFGETASAYGIDYYHDLGAGYSGQIGMSHSPSETFLPRHSFTFGLSKDFNNTTVDLGLRHLIFINTVANVLSAGMDQQITPRLQVRTELLFVPETSAYSVEFAPIWTSPNGDRTFAYVTGGMAGEEVGIAQGVLRTPTYSIMLGHTFNLTTTLSLTGDAFYEHRAGLYNRWGADLSIAKRW
jgi:YaiO family outer membrane protein